MDIWQNYHCKKEQLKQLQLYNKFRFLRTTMKAITFNYQNSFKAKHVLTAGVLALTGLVAPATASASLVSGNASFSINNAAVAGTNADGWFFDSYWGPGSNGVAINASTTGGPVLTSTDEFTLSTSVNTNTTTSSDNGIDRTLQATTMDSSNTSAGQIGLSGALRMGEPTGLGGYLSPYDFNLTKAAGVWTIFGNGAGFGNAPVFTLSSVNESLNTSGELLLSGDLQWAGGFGYALVLGANTSTVIGSFNLAPSAVPVPAAVWLFGTGLVGLIGAGKRKKVQMV